MEFLEDEAFGELRSLVQATPSTLGFARICRAVQRMEQEKPGLFAERYREYVVGALDAWPRHRRTLTIRLGDGERLSGLAWAPLVRAAHVVASGTYQIPSVLEDIEALEGLEHLGLSGFTIKQKPLLAAIDEGLFDGLRSLAFHSMPLRGALFEELVARLSQRDGLAGLEELRFEGCNIKKAHLEMLCSSPLPERLRTLGLSHNTSMKTTGIKVLTAAAARFEALERLELHDAALTSPAAKAIATAPWASVPDYVGLYGNPLKAAGFKALDGAGMLPALVDRQGAPVLDLSGYEFDAGVLTTLVERGLFDGLDTLRCSNSYHATGWEIVGAEAERLTSLKGLVSSTPSLHGPLVERLLDEVKFERLDLSGRPRCIDEDRFVAMLDEQDELEHLRLWWGNLTDDYGENGLEAMMSWSRWDEVDETYVSFGIPEGHRLYGEVMSHPRFRGDHQNTAMGPRFNAMPGGSSSWESSNHCVHADGRLSNAWLFMNVRR